MAADKPRLRKFLDSTKSLEHPLQALEAVRELRRYLLDVEREALGAARDQHASVQDIADALGITRQAVYYKLGQREVESSERTSEPDVIEIPDVEPSASAGESTPQREEAMVGHPLTVGPATGSTTGPAISSKPTGIVKGV
ncbi:MAG TPA: helix-turn-helix domain-containing protein [Actinomycetota bacterium]|nr:helix-turn-helix domain-containing protein [Actinomycetota bacterium]